MKATRKKNTHTHSARATIAVRFTRHTFNFLFTDFVRQIEEFTVVRYADSNEHHAHTQTFFFMNFNINKARNKKKS